MLAPLLERDDVLVEMRFEFELRRLLDERVDEILARDFRETADVEDVFLRIKRGQLPAELRQGVDDLRRTSAHSRIKSGEQPGRTAAGDGDIDDFVAHVSAEIYSRPMVPSLT